MFRKARGIAAALRPIRTQPPSLAQLHLPQALSELARLRNGLVLVAGTAGSGKSTTLAAMIEELNRGDAKHIITLEDPIEYEYRNATCLIHQREIGRDVPDFAGPDGTDCYFQMARARMGHEITAREGGRTAVLLGPRGETELWLLFPHLGPPSARSFIVTHHRKRALAYLGLDAMPGGGVVVAESPPVQT